MKQSALLLAIVLLFAGCAGAQAPAEGMASAMPTKSPVQMPAVETTPVPSPKATPVPSPEAEYFFSIVDQGRNYVILDQYDEQQFVFLILNNEQEVVHHHTYFKDDIEERADGTLRIVYNYGTFGPGYVYYDPVEDRFSQNFDGGAVIAEGFGMIAYIDWERTKTGEIVDKLVIQDLYAPDVFYKEYPRPIAEAVQPKNGVVEAAFIDENTFTFTYYTGEHTMAVPPDNLPTVSETIRFR